MKFSTEQLKRMLEDKMWFACQADTTYPAKEKAMHHVELLKQEIARRESCDTH